MLTTAWQRLHNRRLNWNEQATWAPLFMEGAIEGEANSLVL